MLYSYECVGMHECFSAIPLFIFSHDVVVRIKKSHFSKSAHGLYMYMIYFIRHFSTLVDSRLFRLDSRLFLSLDPRLFLSTLDTRRLVTHASLLL